MAKGTTVGFLNFGIDGDNKELMKKLEQAKKEAISVQQIMQDIMSSRSQATNTQTGNESRRNALNQARIQEIQTRSLERQRIQQEQLAREVLRTESLRQRMNSQSTASQNSLTNAIGLTNKTMFSQRNLLMQMSQALGIYFSIYQVGAFVKELANVSGEFEKQRASLAAILQDTDASTKIFNQVKELAVVSPFNFKELTDYAKQLSAFSIPTNEIFDTMKRLADVSAGLGVDMNRIILAYGQVRSASVLRGQELRQFTEAGIPLVDELAKKFEKLEGVAVSAGDVFDKISNRQVPFEMIKDIFTDLTSEGGKFYQMQEVQSATLAGKISNLRDNYDMMLDSIGQANSGLLHGSVDALVSLMDNWQKYWDILKGIILTYGTYKASVIVISQATMLAAKAQQLYNTWLLASSISGSKFGAALDLITAKFKNLDKVGKATLVGVVLAALVAIGYAIKTAYDNSHKLEKSLADNMSKLKSSVDSSLFTMDNLLARLRSATMYSTQWNDTIKQINNTYGEYLPSLIKESDSYSQIEKQLKGVTSAIYEKAKAQSYANSIDTIQEELSSKTKEVYDKVQKALTEKPLLGLGSLVLSKKDADEAMKNIFSQIKESPELYRQAEQVNKLVADVLGEAFKGRNIDTSISGLLNYSQLQPVFEGAASFANEWVRSTEAMDKAGSIYSIIYDKANNYSKLIDDIAKKYEDVNRQIDNTPITNGFNIDKAKSDAQIKMLNEMLDVYKKFGQINLADETQRKIDAIVKMGEGWKVEMQKILGTTIAIQADTNFNDVVKDIKDKHKELKARMDEQKPILIKMGFDFDKNTFPAGSLGFGSSIYKQMGESFAADAKDMENVTKAAEAMNLTFKEKKKASEKDKFTENLKDQVELIKSAKSEYEKLLKLMPKEKAGESIKSIKEYAKIDLSNLTDEGYVKYLQSMLSKIEKRNTDTAKNVRISWNKELGQIQVEQITDKAKYELDKIEKYLSQYKDKYNLYESIFNITGDKGQAAQLAFGDPKKQVEEYLSVLKDAFKQSAGISFDDFLKLDDKSQQKLLIQDDLKNLVDQIQTESWDSRADFSKRMADLVKEYQSVDEQLTTIRNKGEATRLEILKNADNATQDVIDQRIKANQEATNKQISDLTNGVLQATESYQRLFGEIGEISNKELQLLINRWKDALNNATKDGNGMMKVSIDGKEFTTTEKEIASFTKRVLKSETELRSRNPFKALQDSLNELSSNKSQIQQLKSEIASLQGALAGAERNQANGDSTGLSARNISNIKQRISELTTQLEGMQGKSATSLQKVGVAMSAIGSIAQSVASDLAGMFEALGKESMADTISLIGEMTGALSNIGSGIASGNPVQVVQGIIGGITSIANFHDKKLDRAIQKSQLEVKKLQGSYEQMERFISRQLGAVTEEQAKDQIKNLKAQQAELQKQMDAENKKKKTDKSAIQDYKNSISELQDQIRYFYEDLLDEEYGLNLKSIADELSSSLVDAFKNGENAAKSFDKTVADVINNLAQKMIAMQVIEPAMQKIRDYLFGDNGVFNDGELSVNDAAGLVGLMGGLKDKIGESQAIWDALNEAAKKVGIDLGQTSVKDTLSKGIQSITEDTANLLASYLNAIRADVAATRQIITQLIQISQTNSSTFALQLAELVKIQVNTFNTANNTAQIASTTQATYDLLKSATVPSGGTKFNMA